MIKLEKTEVYGWEAAIRGMRNPKNSWDRMDSKPGCVYHVSGSLVDYCINGATPDTVIGPNDHKLMMDLASGGPVHAKYRRMITVYVDITAPLYWWKEFDTYKIGTVANSCSTMHKIHDKEFTLEDFSCEYLTEAYDQEIPYYFNTLYVYNYKTVLEDTINALNGARDMYLEFDKRLGNDMDRDTHKQYHEMKKKYWWQMIQLLPSSYNQKRTIMLNYEVLAGIYPMRKNHKLDEWHVFCDWIKDLPYSEIITGPRDGKAFFDGSVNLVEKAKEE